MLINNSPVSQFQFNQRTIYVKRDDLLDPNFSGNKARKLAYFLTHPSADIDTLISYGGNQSNLMYSLSCLAKLKNWQFIYYTNQWFGCKCTFIHKVDETTCGSGGTRTPNLTCIRRLLRH